MNKIGAKSRVIFFVLLSAMCAYGVWSTHKWQSGNGAYIIGTIEKISLARNGWKVQRIYTFSGKTYSNSAVYPFEYFNKGSIGNRYFLRILRESPEDGAALIPVVRVPDSIITAPTDGWSEKWMKEHFPEVVAHAHETW